jgi:hypothetical protein
LNFLWIWIVVGLCGIRFNASSDSSQSWNVFAYFKYFNYNDNLKKALYYLSPVVLFIILYSKLPHKELRFIFPALPMFTLFAAVSLNELLPKNSKDLVFPFSLLSNDDTDVAKEIYSETVKVSKKNDDDDKSEKVKTDTSTAQPKLVPRTVPRIYRFLLR